MWCTQFITHIILAAAEGLWHLGSLFYHNTQYSQWGWYITNLLLCGILQNKAPRTGPRHIWRIYTLCPFFDCEKTADGSAGGLMISLASVCYGDFCWGLLLLLLLLFFFLKIVFNITSVRTWFQVGCQQPEFHLWLTPQVLFFFWPLLKTHIHLPSLDYYVWLGTFAET